LNNEKIKRTLEDVENTFYETMSKNTVFSSLNRSASALEKLSNNTETLAAEMKSASESSTRLTTSLNRLTLAAVIIAGGALILEVVKLCIGK
jgi:uncharacterized phage infection (PIP) family protein YhgE